MPPISTNLANKGYVTDELVKHYGDRARGGVGLIVSEVVTVEPVYVYLPGDMSIHDDSYIEGWRKVFEEVHKYGTVLLPQLFHPAFMAFPLPGTPQLIAPSNVGPYYAKAAPRAVTKEEIEVLIKQFGDAAYRMKIAGGDGVEIHAAHAHTLIFAVGYKVDRTLIDTLDRLGIKYHLVGDSNKVASIKEAITDALNLTKDL